jgi:hypothetical protein
VKIRIAYAAVLISMALGLLGGCSGLQGAPPSPSPSGWLIDSWEDGVITAQHEGHTYAAKCDLSAYMDPTGHNGGFQSSPTCILPLDLIGHNVQDFGGKERDRYGWIVEMWNAGEDLEIKRPGDRRPTSSPR